MNPSDTHGHNAEVVVPTEQDVLHYFDSLSNWSRWGGDDERGTLNLITPQVRLRAAATITEGMSVSCAWDVAPVGQPGDVFGPPQRFMVMTGEGLGDRHRVIDPVPGYEDVGPRLHGASEYIGMVFHGFNVTHLDALSHIFWDRSMYNGAPPELVNSLRGAGRHAITVAHGGIMTRGVLLDVAAMHGGDWLEPGEGVLPGDLEAAERRQGVQVREGDAVLLRTGYGRRKRALGPVDPKVAGQPGWQAACLPWLRERGVALIGSDTSNDVMPSGYPQLPLPVHIIGIVAMGLWLLDNLDLEEVVTVANALGRFEFFLAVAPLRLVGGTGSPVNPVAVF